LSQYFQENFTYSLDLDGRKSEPTPLEHFLHNSRKGTASSLPPQQCFLCVRQESRRAMRLAILYKNSVSSRTAFLVRARHAHAWTLVYVDGMWRNLDTTPASWTRAEEEAASFLEPLKDLLSYTLFNISVWRWTENKMGLRSTWDCFSFLPPFCIEETLFKKTEQKRPEKEERKRR